MRVAVRRNASSLLLLLGLMSAAPAFAQTCSSYTYDELGRLRNATYTGGPSGTRTVDYTLDAAGNRTTLTSGAGTTPPDTTAPSTPAAPAATPVSSTQVNLSWVASTDICGSGVAGYKVYRNGTEIGSSTTLSYSDSTTSGTTTYTYRIAAYDVATNLSAQSPQTQVTTPDTIAPAVPTGLAATITYPNSISVSWGAAADTGGSGTKNYDVYRDGALLGTVAVTTFVDSAATATSYSYKVAARDNANNVSAQSTALVVTKDTTPPSAPVLSSTAISTTRVDLSWTASTDTGGSGLSQYRIYRNTTLINSTTATSFSDTGVVANTQYAYQVVAADGAGNTAGSNSSSVWTDKTPPSVPTQPGITVQPNHDVLVFWQASTDTVSGLAGYRIYRDGGLVGTTSNPVFTDPTPTANVTHQYRVSAYDNAGNESAQTAAVNAFVDTIPPSTPSNLVATSVTVNQVSLSWGASTDNGQVSLYNITRSGVLIAVITDTPYTYTDATVASNTTYNYAVTAQDGGGNLSTPATLTVTTPAGAPSPPGLTPGTQQNTTGTYTITWTPSTGPVANYVLEERVGPFGTFVPESPTTATSRTYTNKSSEEYTYQVKACTAGGVCSGYSSQRTIVVCRNGC